MKTILFLITFSILYPLNLRSQDSRDDVETPKGSNVQAWDFEEASAADRAYADSIYDFTYPNATQIATYNQYSSTRRFNCHGYAWYMMSEEGGENLYDPRWIGYQSSSHEDIYMTDGSYKKVDSETYPGKVSWSSGDHSAITTSTSGVWLSKWNQYPLMQHNWNDSPYGTSNLEYYKLCYEEIINQTISNNLTKEVCGLHIEDVSLTSGADFEVEFEDWIRVEGPFSTTLGTTLDFHPE